MNPCMHRNHAEKEKWIDGKLTKTFVLIHGLFHHIHIFNKLKKKPFSRSLSLFLIPCATYFQGIRIFCCPQHRSRPFTAAAVLVLVVVIVLVIHSMCRHFDSLTTPKNISVYLVRNKHVLWLGCLHFPSTVIPKLFHLTS